MNSSQIIPDYQTRLTCCFDVFYLQVMAVLTNSEGFLSMAVLFQTLSDRGLLRWLTRECGPATSAASSESPMDVSLKSFQGITTLLITNRLTIKRIGKVPTISAVRRNPSILSLCHVLCQTLSRWRLEKRQKLHCHHSNQARTKIFTTILFQTFSKLVP